ncbi:MAG: amidohydrolase family protein [candidate division KSB1 bacterium]|nr:amidohydrolase family protein [candidate division KSB1 bacterium]
MLIWSPAALVTAQITPVEGLRDNTPQVHALVNARIVPAPGQVIDKGTVIIRDGLIVAAGAQVTPPPDARLWDYSGKTLYAGFIEPYVTPGVPARTPGARGAARTEARTEARPEERRGPRHWNPLMRAEEQAEDLFQPDQNKVKALRELGFCAALIAPGKGIFRGTSALVSLGDGGLERGVLKRRVAQHLAFETAGEQEGGYPNSLLGSIAFIRQTLLDAQWYQAAMAAYRRNPAQPRPEESPALAALAEVIAGRQPVIFEVNDDLNLVRALNVAKEFHLALLVRGSGQEYRQRDRLRAAGVPLILPLDFPQKPKVDTPEDALEVSLEELQHWDMAPANPYWLHQAGVTFAFTTDKLKKESDFTAALRKAIASGLPASAALAALTTIPAKLLGEENRLGSIGAGKLANLVVTEGEFFAEKFAILDVWIEGRRYEIKKPAAVDLRGKWELALTHNGRHEMFQLELKGTAERLSGELSKDKSRAGLSKAQLDEKRILLAFKGDSLGLSGVIRLTGLVEAGNLQGRGELADGSAVTWSARRLEAFQEKTAEKSKPASPPPVWRKLYPYGSFGRSAPPEQPAALLVRGATIWTCGPAGKLENADMLVKAGTIAQVGKNLTAPAGATIIAAGGKHVTPGLIDAHSHAAVSAVNESGQAVTAEVSIGEVIDPSDVNIYQQLAGGLTTAHVMHGSANPIGGRNQVMKWRWGADAEGLKFVEAPPTIKFALGENVKQSNWGDRFTTRYPQTRMGVEQIIRDRFQAARDYEQAWNDFAAANKKNPGAVVPPRRDLELETLLEILQGRRFIHCHSYRQDEILMLVRLAEEFGFKVGTFQHVLEGYKVADAISTHGAGASCFSDWWAYKFEVYDAIPYNGALMHRQGIVVSFNSDSGELARRMNLEAAKAVKYGGLSEEEALKFVTLNPAKQLKVDHLIGSLEPGKQADFVIWSGAPLSTYSICEQTWIEGRKYFDRAEDRELRAAVEKERAALIQKVLADRDESAKDSPTEAKQTTD